MRIGIDMGHTLSGAGTGAVGFVKETDKNREAGKRLIAMLQEKGHTVVNCTVDSSSNDLADRVRKANAQKLDLFLSIHLNAYQRTSSEMGVETYSLSTSGTGRDKSVAIQNALVAATGWKNRGSKTANYYVLRNTTAPAVLTELGFCDSEGDMKKWNTEKIAAALFKGITGSEYVSSNPTPIPPSTGGEFKIGDYNGNVKTNDNLNVRSGRGTEFEVIGTLNKDAIVKVMYILPDNRDGKGNDDLWGSISYNGKTGYIHLGYVTPVSASAPAPVAPKPPSDDDIIKEYAEKGYGIPRTTVNVRNVPSVNNNSPVAKYVKGEKINSYDKVVVTRAFTWISYMSTSGVRRYVAVKNQKTGERYVDCY